MRLISIHIPKTAGTSFYSILSQVYGHTLSPNLKREDIQQLRSSGQLDWPSSPLPYEVLHGHFRYDEIASIITPGTYLICWLRDPIQRVISNYHFFKALFRNPERNPANYERNKHRVDEPLEVYAAMPENQNRICEFLAGAPLKTFDFVGHVESFVSDIAILSRSLSWPVVDLPYLNSNPNKTPVYDRHILEQLIAWNQADIHLYCEYLSSRAKPIPAIYKEIL